MTDPTPLDRADVAAILSHRQDLGGDTWTTPDNRLAKGAPFSALECVGYLLELGVPPTHPLLEKTKALLWNAYRKDGRFQLYPKGGILPCHTILAAQALCRLGAAQDPRLQRTFHHLLDTRHLDGGWRCNKFSFGRGPETACSNPHPTLLALDIFRQEGAPCPQEELSGAVDFLLSHWDIRQPIGPCHYGIGTLFMQVEYPFRNYNLFAYVYILSFYEQARRDRRFQEAFAALQGKLVDGHVIVERVVPKLAGLNFCKKGQPSAHATRRYQEICRNLEQ